MYLHFFSTQGSTSELAGGRILSHWCKTNAISRTCFSYYRILFWLALWSSLTPFRSCFEPRFVFGFFSSASQNKLRQRRPNLRLWNPKCAPSSSLRARFSDPSGRSPRDSGPCLSAASQERRLPKELSRNADASPRLKNWNATRNKRIKAVNEKH